MDAPLPPETLATPASPFFQDSSSMMFHYLGSMVGYTSLVIVGLWFLYRWLKQHPVALAWVQRRLGILRNDASSETPPSGAASQLQIEEVLPLTEQRQLVLVRCGEDKLLLSMQGDDVQFLTKLDHHHPSALPNALQQMMNQEDRVDHPRQAQQQGYDTGYTQRYTDAHGDVILSNQAPLLEESSTNKQQGVTSPWQHIRLPQLGWGKRS
ncbi:MAG: flagellar biosynthetic protein FliO [Vampirovibrionales bacterium]